MSYTATPELEAKSQRTELEIKNSHFSAAPGKGELRFLMAVQKQLESIQKLLKAAAADQKKQLEAAAADQKVAVQEAVDKVFAKMSADRKAAQKKLNDTLARMAADQKATQEKLNAGGTSSLRILKKIL